MRKYKDAAHKMPKNKNKRICFFGGNNINVEEKG
jgi:hypothetical protein